jgi:hypothetical protein
MDSGDAGKAAMKGFVVVKFPVPYRKRSATPRFRTLSGSIKPIQNSLYDLLSICYPLLTQSKILPLFLLNK